MYSGVPSFDLSSETDHVDWGFCEFIQARKENAGKVAYLNLGQDRFLPNILRCIIRW
jgi:hypothetical protein